MEDFLAPTSEKIIPEGSVEEQAATEFVDLKNPESWESGWESTQSHIKIYNSYIGPQSKTYQFSGSKIVMPPFILLF